MTWKGESVRRPLQNSKYGFGPQKSPRTSSFNFFLSFMILTFLKSRGELLHRLFLSFGFVFCPDLLDPGYEFLVGKPCR